MAMDEIRRSKRIISMAAGLSVLAVAGFWMTRGDARSERAGPPEELTLEEPILSDSGMREVEFPGLVRVPLLERMSRHFELSKGQIAKAQAIIDDYGPRIRELRERSEGDDLARAEGDRLRTERNTRLTELLTAEQRRKLSSFSWRRPPGAFPVI
jgi:hypothetical protein